MKRLTIVPPTYLVTMFGVPESVGMPARVGDEVTFEAHGKRWHTKRVNRISWNLWAPLHSPRMRWGTRKEIAEDIGVVLETGAMPQSKERMA